jgi:hypothetical protein
MKLLHHTSTLETLCKSTKNMSIKQFKDFLTKSKNKSGEMTITARFKDDKTNIFNVCSREVDGIWFYRGVRLNSSFPNNNNLYMISAAGLENWVEDMVISK